MAKSAEPHTTKVLLETDYWVIHKRTQVYYGIPDPISEGADMPVTISGRTYYHTAEVCRMVGISRNTLFRWVKVGVAKQPAGRDRRGWRLFTLNQIEEIKAEVNRTI